jgi:hypothetical protein
MQTRSTEWSRVDLTTMGNGNTVLSKWPKPHHKNTICRKQAVAIATATRNAHASRHRMGQTNAVLGCHPCTCVSLYTTPEKQAAFVKSLVVQRQKECREGRTNSMNDAQSVLGKTFRQPWFSLAV